MVVGLLQRVIIMSQAKALRLLSRAIEMASKSQSLLSEATQMLADAGTPVLTREERTSARAERRSPAPAAPAKKARAPKIEISHGLKSEISRHASDIQQELSCEGQPRLSQRDLAETTIDTFAPSAKVRAEFKKLMESDISVVTKAVIAILRN